MPKNDYLKAKNVPIVVIFIIWCISIYVVFFSGTSSFWSELQVKFAELNSKDSLVVAIMPILVVILSGLISSNLKAIIVFWRIKHALPGHRVFTKLAPVDARINIDALEHKMKTIPVDPKEQNTEWFKLYKKYENVVTVKHAQKNFLLTRDLATISLIFAVVGTIGLVFGRVLHTQLITYFALMFGHYIVLAIVAQNHGRRFVCNVVAEYVTDN